MTTETAYLIIFILLGCDLFGLYVALTFRKPKQPKLIGYVTHSGRYVRF